MRSNNHSEIESKGSTDTLPLFYDQLKLNKYSNRSHHVEYDNNLEDTDSDYINIQKHIKTATDRTIEHEVGHINIFNMENDETPKKLSFVSRKNVSQYLDLWLIMFHFISIISYLSESYIGFRHFEIYQFFILVTIIIFQCVCFIDDGDKYYLFFMGKQTLSFRVCHFVFYRYI